MWLDGQRPPGSVGGAVRDRVAGMQRLALEKAHAAGPAEPTVRLAAGSPSDVRVPTLVLVGELDWPDMLDVAEAYAREIPGARRVVMPDVAHIPSLERPEEFDQLVLDFLG
jgi:pimeloyl-ACP methyl ester carboxylesterase